ncbi:hypothetical protein NPIL_480491 [Nephila pilipes]|uniref:Uncharacterized protein n=1 Tax=Nephila pilipes TaxID=299642 RepID=A0A8X6TXI1_NEPPI|nr:hypothetical protein NPIL_480491 [Nephila pilipes]
MSPTSSKIFLSLSNMPTVTICRDPLKWLGLNPFFRRLTLCTGESEQKSMEGSKIKGWMSRLIINRLNVCNSAWIGCQCGRSSRIGIT